MQRDFNILTHKYIRVPSSLFLLLFSRVLLDKESPPSSFPSPQGTIVIPARGKNRYSGMRLLAAHVNVRSWGHLCIEFELVGLFFRRPFDRSCDRSQYAALFLRAHKTSALCLAKQCPPHVALTCGRTSEDSWLGEPERLLLR